MSEFSDGDPLDLPCSEELRRRGEERGCAQEPIHACGAIQPFGGLLCLSEPELTIVQVSANAAELFGVEAVQLIGQPASRLLDGESVEALSRALGRPSLRGVNPLKIAASGAHFDGIVHRSEGGCVLELEPRGLEGDGGHDLLDQVLFVVDRLTQARTAAALCEAAVQGVCELTGFERTLIYRFHDDGHGEVIAESRVPDMDSYLHLHFPAVDIPAQVRQLYLQCRTRQIIDRDSRPAALVPPASPISGRPLDLSRSVLRGVAPCHIDYMRNMGISASMSIALLKEGMLWGLIACHNRRPLHTSFQRRMTCELLGQVLSWQLATMARHELSMARHRASSMISRLTESMSTAEHIVAGLCAHAPSVADLVDAAGVAICHEGRWTCLGATPGESDLHEIGAWVRERIGDGVYATSALAREKPELARLKDAVCGVLALSFSDSEAPCDLVLWLRPERVRTVQWRGRPNPPLQRMPDGQRLTPHGSFAAWLERIHLEAQPWQPWEIEIARELRGAIVGTVLRRTAELERLNAELCEAVRTRDDFLSMASHELRTPIFTLALQLDGLTRAAGRARGALSLEQALPRLEVAKRQVRRLEQLIGSLLDFSRINAGRLSLDLEEVHLSRLLHEVVSRFGDDLSASGCSISVRVEGDIVGRWDAMRLDQVVTNLLSNAIKYGAGKPIAIEAVRAGDRARVAVMDLGIGVERVDQARIFERFERAVSPDHHSGLGLGLWIVRHVVERLGGSVAVVSERGEGSTFIVELPLAGPEASGPGGSLD